MDEKLVEAALKAEKALLDALEDIVKQLRVALVSSGQIPDNPKKQESTCGS